MSSQSRSSLWVGALVVVLMVLFFERTHAEACGSFRMNDLESGERLSFDHSMVRLTRIKHNHKSIAVSVRGYQRKVPLYSPYADYNLLGSSQNVKLPDSDCTSCWSPKEVRRNLKLHRHQSIPAIWFEEGRIRVHGHVIGTWSADSITIGDEKYTVKFGSDLGHGHYSSLEVTRGQKVVLRTRAEVMDVCGAAHSEGKTVKRRPMEPSYRKGIWRRVALYLIAKHVAN